MSNEEKILQIITEMQGDFKKFDKRLENVEKQQIVTDKKITAIDKKQKEMDKKQKEMAKDIKIIKEDVKYLHSASNEAFRDIGTLTKRTDHIKIPTLRSNAQ